MKIVKINRLEMENFKGIRNLTLELNGRSAEIYGENGTCKSSVYDAFTWLLFGKDSGGSAKFDVKPVDSEGNVIPGAMPTVTAELDVDGTTVTLRKQLREKWEKHRGGEERYGGNTVDYYIDDVPTKERQYKAQIEALVAPESTFQLLTNPYRFCLNIGWKERREVLFDIAGVVSDAEILAEPGFDDLREELGNRSIDDFRAMLTKQRKDVNGKLNLLPARIDECERQLGELPDSFDDSERALIEREIRAQQEQITMLDTDEGRKSVDNRVLELELELRQLKLDNTQHRRSQDVPVADNRAPVQREIDGLTAEIKRLKDTISAADTDVQMSELRVSGYREDWKKINREAFVGGTCRLCGQPLPAARLEEAKARFEKDKRERLARLVKDSQGIKDFVAQQKDRIQDDKDKLAELEKQLTQAQDKLASIEAPKPVVIEDLPDYHEKRSALEREMAALNQRRQEMRADSAEVRRKLQSRLDDLKRARADEDQKEAQYKQREPLHERIAELEQERRAKAAHIEHIDELLDLCESFVQVKVDRISDAVNARFRLCRWRLFTEAINGNLQDCCDALVNGVPYGTVNSAMQINAGLDCIRALSDHYGLRVPLFVDNAESVTHLYDLDTQVIQLVVSKKDKELRCKIQ